MPRVSRRSFSALAAAFGFFGAESLARVRAAEGAAALPDDVVLESNVRVAMRDGVHLATDVYRPARGGVALGGRFPAILERTHAWICRP
jgi:hypothetical protein